MNKELQLLISRYIKCDISEITSDRELKSLGAADWQIIEMAMEFEMIFKVPMDADKALSLGRVADWEKLITEGP